MELEKQVCTLRQAKRLKELGVKQESLWTWQNQELVLSPITEADCNKEVICCSVCGFDLNKSGKTISCNCSDWGAKGQFEWWEWKGFKDDSYEPYSAFTVAELGVMLPENYSTEKLLNEFVVKPLTNYVRNDIYDMLFTTEAEARAALLINLLESSIITAEQVSFT